MGNLPICGTYIDYDEELLVKDPNALPRMNGQRLLSILQKSSLEDLLARHGGVLQVTDFLPEEQARGALELLQGLEQKDWAESKTTQKFDAPHHFYRYDPPLGSGLDDIKKFVNSLAPNMFPTLHGAKYLGGGLISKHDDAHNFRIAHHDKNATARYPVGHEMYRKVAVIIYFTENWTQEYGGCLVDLNAAGKPKLVVPEFNSAVMFLVPRDHEVTQMHPGSPGRYTAFGWLADDEPYGQGNPYGRQGTVNAHKALSRVRAADDEVSTTSDEDGSDHSTSDEDEDEVSPPPPMKMK